MIFIFIFGGILFSTWMNWWQTESNKTPAKFTQGEFSGEYNPLDIRGSYTFGDIESSFGIPSDLLARAFIIPEDSEPYLFQVKTLESIYSFTETELGTGSIRLFVALYAGLPYQITEDTYLPSQAVEILKLHGNLTAEQIDYIDSHSVQVNDSEITEQVNENQAESDSSNSRFISGKTIFRDVLDWGISRTEIENILGAEMPNPLQKIKDYCIANNIPFETIKSSLQAEIDKLP